MEEEKKNNNDETSNGASANDEKKSNVRMYTKEEVEQRLRGQGRLLSETTAKLEEAQKKIDELAAKEAERTGDYKSILEKIQSEKAVIEAELTKMKDENKNRLESLKTQVKARFEKLPDELKELATPQLIDVDPNLASEQILKLERQAILVSDSSLKVGNKASSSDNASNHDDDVTEKMKNIFFGGKK